MWYLFPVKRCIFRSKLLVPCAVHQLSRAGIEIHKNFMKSLRICKMCQPCMLNHRCFCQVSVVFPPWAQCGGCHSKPWLANTIWERFHQQNSRLNFKPPAWKMDTHRGNVRQRDYSRTFCTLQVQLALAMKTVELGTSTVFLPFAKRWIGRYRLQWSSTILPLLCEDRIFPGSRWLMELKSKHE